MPARVPTLSESCAGIVIDAEFPETLISDACGYLFAGLPHSRSAAAVSRDRDQIDHGAASNGDDLILDDVKTNDRRGRFVIEVASNCVANHGLQLFDGFCLGKNSMPERPSFVPSLRRIMHRKTYFTVVHAHNCIPCLARPRVSKSARFQPRRNWRTIESIGSYFFFDALAISAICRSSSSALAANTFRPISPPGCIDSDMIAGNSFRIFWPAGDE